MTTAGRLPDFLLVGAQKSGTGTVHTWLKGHPATHMSSPKEIHYFDLNYERGPDWYRGHFAGAAPGAVAGESTPDYLYLHEAVERLAADVPSARLVVLLRDPVDRAYSHYQHVASRGWEPLRFSEALAAEPGRLATGDLNTRSQFSYTDRGRYLHQLRTLHRLFGADRVHVELFEDVRDHPRDTFQRIAQFIGVDPEDVPEAVGRRVNEYRSPRLRRFGKLAPRAKRVRKVLRKVERAANRGYKPMGGKDKAQLLRTYLPERDELQALIDRDLSGWIR